LLVSPDGSVEVNVDSLSYGGQFSALGDRLASMSIRRVVTGVTAEGTSVFVSDQRVEAVAPALLPGLEFHRLWGQDEPPVAPQDGTPPPSYTFFPPAGGYRVGTFTVPVTLIAYRSGLMASSPC
jgi:hypothetical protein